MVECGFIRLAGGSSNGGANPQCLVPFGLRRRRVTVWLIVVPLLWYASRLGFGNWTNSRKCGDFLNSTSMAWSVGSLARNGARFPIPVMRSRLLMESNAPSIFCAFWYPLATPREYASETCGLWIEIDHARHACTMMHVMARMYDRVTVVTVRNISGVINVNVIISKPVFDSVWKLLHVRDTWGDWSRWCALHVIVWLRIQ